MPACTVCAHPDSHAINLALVDRASYRAIASRFSLQRASVQRHAANHLPAAIARGVASTSDGASVQLVATSPDDLADLELAQRVRAFEAQADRQGETLRSHLLRDFLRLDALHAAAVQVGNAAMAASHLRTKWLIAGRAGFTGRLDQPLAAPDGANIAPDDLKIANFRKALYRIAEGLSDADCGLDGLEAEEDEDDADDGVHPIEEPAAAPTSEVVRVRVRRRP